MANSSRPLHRDEFEIAIICTLRLEFDAISPLFDEYWDEDGDKYGRASGDQNTYTTGRVGHYNVVLALLPGMGKASAASAAANFRSSYNRIQLALLVGICGGVPKGIDGEKEILLGDVVISQQVIQYDFGAHLPNGISRKDTLQDSLGRPNADIRAFLATLQTGLHSRRLQMSTLHHLTALQEKLGPGNFRYPGIAEDKLFEPAYRHKHHDSTNCALCSRCIQKLDPVCEAALNSSCSELHCDESQLLPRLRLKMKIEGVDSRQGNEIQKPDIHFGPIASGDVVMKSGEDRDMIAERDKVIAFEMEGAGVWDNLPCIIIKGVCDYADSHKNKKWQNFAAATSASAMKALLERYIRTDRPSRQTAPHFQLRDGINARLEPPNPISEPVGVSVHRHSTKPRGWHSPVIGYDRYLRDIETRLNGDVWQHLIIGGQQGAGKSLCLAKIAQACESSYSVFWFSADSPQKLMGGFEKAMSEVSKETIVAPETHVRDPVLRMQLWLSNPAHGQWVVFLDDTPDQLTHSQLSKVFPASPLGRLIVSKRSRDGIHVSGMTYLPIPRLSVDDACELFFSVYGETTDELVPAVSLLASTLNFHPSSIVFAASHLRLNANKSLDEYLQKLQVLEVTAETYDSILSEVSLALSVTLDGLINTPARQLLELFIFLDTERITEEFLGSCRRATFPYSSGTMFACLSFHEFQPARQTLLSLALLDTRTDDDGTFLTVPRCVAEYVLARLRRDRTRFQSTAQMALVLLNTVTSPHRLRTMDTLNEVMSLNGPHYLSLTKLARSEHLQLDESFGNLGLLVSLHHLGKAAGRGFGVSLARCFKGWLSRNRNLTGDDRIEPSLYDEVTQIPPIPVEIPPSLEVAQRLKVPISSALWHQIEGLTMISALARAWFEIKEEVLARARKSVRKFENEERVEDQVDKGAHAAILQAVRGAVEEYVRTVENSGTVASEVLGRICRMAAHGLDEIKLTPFSEVELTTIISNALGNEIFGLTNAVGRAWASVLNRQKQKIASMVESLVQQCVDPQSLPGSVQFTIEQFSNRDFRHYVREIVEALWEAVGAAGCWIATLIKTGIGLAIVSRSADSLSPYPGNFAYPIQDLVDSCMMLIVDAGSVALRKCHRNCEWTALVRNTIYHCLAAEQAKMYSETRNDTGVLSWKAKLRSLQGDSEWSWFGQDDLVDR